MRVSGLRPDHKLGIYCAAPTACVGRVTFTRDEAIERFGADFELAMIRARGRCTRCGYLGAKIIVQFVGSTGVR